MAEVNPPAFETGQCYDAGTFRGMVGSLVCGSGVSTVSSGALEVTPVPDQFAVQVAAGEAFIEGTQVENQGMYWVTNDAPVVLEVQPSDPTDARIDLVVATVNDSEFFGTDNNWVLQVIQGTPSPAPAEPTVPDNSIVLARLDIAAGAVSPVDVTDLREDYKLCNASSAYRLVFYGREGTFRKADYPNMSWCEVTVTGAGGGGGGAAASGGAAAGGGGGSGASARGIFLPSDLPASVNITGGTGGGGGSNDGQGHGTSGERGEASRFGSFLVAQGGGGGQGMAGGSAAGSVYGGVGGEATVSPAVTGGGQSIGMRGGSGGAGLRLTGTDSAAGDGGDSFWGGGGRGPAGSVSGQPGVVGGGGAGGSSQGSAPAYTGGRGGNGIVIIDVH